MPLLIHTRDAAARYALLRDMLRYMSTRHMITRY